MNIEDRKRKIVDFDYVNLNYSHEYSNRNKKIMEFNKLIDNGYEYVGNADGIRDGFSIVYAIMIKYEDHSESF